MVDEKINEIAPRASDGHINIETPLHFQNVVGLADNQGAVDAQVNGLNFLIFSNDKVARLGVI